MIKGTSAGIGYHAILTDEHHYVCQHIVNVPDSSGNVLRPPPTSPITLSLPIL